MNLIQTTNNLNKGNCVSRWIESFENHPFQEFWKKIITETERLEADDETIVTDIEEISRLKKAVFYVNACLETCDPELVPEKTWTNFNSQANACFQQIEHYQNNKDIGHIKQANTHLDNLITYIKPYQRYPKEEAIAAESSFREYTKTVNQSLSVFKEKAEDTLKDLKNLKLQTQNNAEESTDLFSRIKEFEETCFDDSDKESLRTKIEHFANRAKEIHDACEDFQHELFEGDSTYESISSSIKNALEESKNDSRSIREHLEDIDEITAEIKSFYSKIFGKETETGSREGGLKHEISKRIDDLDKFQRRQETQHKTLVEKIESLLPGATSAGLASAYHELKNSFDAPIKTYSILFYISIGLLVGTSIISITDSVGWLFINFIDASDTKVLISNVLHKLPVVLPVLWLAVFASKRRSEALRLQQEYSHKEAIAKSYQNFKSQIDALNQKDEELSRKLLGAAIDAVANNASDTLDRKHGDKLPLDQCIESVADSLDKIKKAVNK